MMYNKNVETKTVATLKDVHSFVRLYLTQLAGHLVRTDGLLLFYREITNMKMANTSPAMLQMLPKICKAFMYRPPSETNFLLREYQHGPPYHS